MQYINKRTLDVDCSTPHVAKRRRMFVQRQLQAIDPRILACICSNETDFEELVKNVEWQLDFGKSRNVFDEDIRMWRAKYGAVNPFPLPIHGKQRGQCAYAFLEPSLGGYVVNVTQYTLPVCAKFQEYYDRTGMLGVEHLAAIVELVRSIAIRDDVEKIMVGKASHCKSSTYAHRGMVNRYRFYKPFNYTHMLGIMFVSGKADRNAEVKVLEVEQLLHGIFKKICSEKFHSEMASDSVGGLVTVEDPSEHFFTLYIAIHLKNTTDACMKT